MKDQELRLLPNTGLSRLKWEYERERTGLQDLLCMGTADMDYRTPEPILRALHRILEQGHLGYPSIPDAYYDMIHDWLFRMAGWNIDARSCVVNSAGIYMAARSVIQVLTSPGDKITIMTPVHFCFKGVISLNERFTIECPLLLEKGKYRIDFAALEACLASGSKMLWICNPHNPVGRVWKKSELKKIADLCEKYQVYILSDDVYCGLTFPGVTYTPIASLSKKISYRTVTLYSTSKIYNTAGIRHSFMVSENPEIVKRYGEEMLRLSMNYGQNTMGLGTVFAAYMECDGWLENLRNQIQKNHQFLSDYVMSNLPGAEVTYSEATYFAWVDFRQLCMRGKQIAYLLEQEEHMIVESGAEAGRGGDGFVRINLATSEENLTACAKKLKHFWFAHKK